MSKTSSYSSYQSKEAAVKVDRGGLQDLHSRDAHHDPWGPDASTREGVKSWFQYFFQSRDPRRTCYSWRLKRPVGDCAVATLVSLQIPRTGFKITKKFSLEAILLILTISDLQVLSQFMMEWEKDKTPAMLGSKRFFSQCGKKNRSYSIKKQ